MNQIATIARAAPINWNSIETMPDNRKDGRDMLLWNGHPVVCLWCDGWRDPVGRLVTNATCYADVEGPGE